MKKIEYQPGRFAPLFEKYPELWDLLRRKTTVTRMKEDSRHGRPAVVALDSESEEIWEVLDRATEAGDYDAVKQMIGSMTKQSMQAEGYKIIPGPPRAITSSWIFASGARYRHRDWKTLYVLRSRNHRKAREYCISKKRRLGQLNEGFPERCADWTNYRKCRMKHELERVLRGTLESFEWDVDTIDKSWESLCKAVKENGFVILTPVGLLED